MISCTAREPTNSQKFNILDMFQTFSYLALKEKVAKFDNLIQWIRTGYEKIWTFLGPMCCKQPVFTDMTLFRINAQTQCRVLILFWPNTKLTSLFMHMPLIQHQRVAV